MTCLKAEANLQEVTTWHSAGAHRSSNRFVQSRYRNLFYPTVYTTDMDQDQIDNLVREQGGPYVFDRMFSAVEKVRERLDRACQALNSAEVPYAVIGGNAVAAWVATCDEGAVRNTRDVDILLDPKDFDAAKIALEAVGFHQVMTMGVTMFLDGEDGKPSEGVHVIWAGQKVKESYPVSAPDVGQARDIEQKKIVELEALLSMKLVSFRDKDRVHIRDMIGVGLIDQAWANKFDSPLSDRLQELLDDPDG